MTPFTHTWILQLHAAGVRPKVIAIVVGYSATYVRRVIREAAMNERRAA